MIKKTARALIVLIPAAYSIVKLINNYKNLYAVYNAMLVLCAAVFIVYFLLALFKYSKKLKIRIIVPWGITFIFLFELLIQMNFKQFGSLIRTFRYGYLLIYAIIFLITFLLRGLRWQYLLKSVGKVGFVNSYHGVMIGFLCNSIFPARAGEFIRAYEIGKLENISKSGAFATVVMERIYDGVIILFMLIALILFMPFDSEVIKYAGIGGAVIYIGALIVMVFILLYEKKIITILSKKIKNPELFEKIKKLLLSFSSGIKTLKNKKDTAIITLLSVLIWGISIGTLMPLVAGFDLGYNYDLMQISTLLIVAIALAITIPSAPGGMGPFQWSIYVSLLALAPEGAVKESTAISFSMFVWFMQIIPLIILGVISMIMSGTSLKELKKASEQEQKD